MTPNDDELEQTLRRSLEQIEDAADLICRGIGFFDPDRLETDLGSEAEQLRGALAQLMEAPEGSEAAGLGGSANLAVLASGLASLVDPDAAPLRLEVHQGELPPAAAGVDELLPAIRRLLQIGVTHAGTGGVVTIDPRTIDGDPALMLVARPAAGQISAALLPATARCRSLADFADHLGGALAFEERDQGEIAACLRFPRGAAEPQ